MDTKKNADERMSTAWDEFFQGPFKTAVEAEYNESWVWTEELLDGIARVAYSSFRAGWEAKGIDLSRRSNIVMALDNASGFNALYIHGQRAIQDHDMYAGQALLELREKLGIGCEIINVVLPEEQDFPETLADVMQYCEAEDEPRATDHEPPAAPAAPASSNEPLT